MTFIQIAFIRTFLLRLPDRHHHHHRRHHYHLANARWQVLLFSSPGHSVVVRVNCTQLNITTSDSSDALAPLYTSTSNTSQIVVGQVCHYTVLDITSTSLFGADDDENGKTLRAMV